MAERWQRNPELEHQWRQRVADWNASGQSVRAFCREHGISECRLFFWKRELRKRDRESSDGGDHKGSRAPTLPTASPVVSVKIVSRKPAAVFRSTAIEIIFGEATVRVPNGVDVTTLSHVLELLKRGQDVTSVSGGADSSVQNAHRHA